MASPWLIVGLGNPEPRYAHNRHNVGHLAVDILAQRAGVKFSQHKAPAQIASVRIGFAPGGAPGPQALLAKPGSYMNLSGGPVKALCQFYRIDPSEKLLVIHDELDLGAHTLRLKYGGGEGGHNGLRSISSALGNRNYARLRVGVGRPPGRQDPADFVLADFPAREREEWALTLSQAADAAEQVVLTGFTCAQQQLHTQLAH